MPPICWTHGATAMMMSMVVSTKAKVKVYEKDRKLLKKEISYTLVFSKVQDSCDSCEITFRFMTVVICTLDG